MASPYTPHTPLITSILSRSDAERLKCLIPKEHLLGHSDLLFEVRGASSEDLGGGEKSELIRAGLLYALDALDEAHRIVQEDEGALAAYWHGMMHRREGDFDNARYWFRRAGELPFFAELHRKASESSALFAKQFLWEPYLFVGQCEQCRFGDNTLEGELVSLQRLEFDVVFDYSWRQGH